MSIPQAGGGPIESRDDLVRYLEQGSKPKSQWRIGTEHEKFGFDLARLKPLPYDGPTSIRAMLEGLGRFGWVPVREGETLIGLSQNGASVSLEPGGQLELSGAPLETVHDTCREVHAHLDLVARVAREIGAGFLGMGFAPTWARDEMPVMPKGRYAIMRRYMPVKGGLGLDMMFRTCTVQVNLDFSSEADMVKKARVALALQPVATALFARSPFTAGKPNGFLSFRSQIWTDVDPDRTGMLPFVFDDGFGFERYVDYALDVPMYFVYRDGRYIDVAGVPFRKFLAGEVPELKGQTPTLSDWADHLTTIFPEVRLKRFLEMRGADGGPWTTLCALPALWVGLLYDQDALDEAAALIADWTREERETLRARVPREGLAAPFRRGTVRDLAREMLRLSRQGLVARARSGALQNDETAFLETLDDAVARGMTPAEDLLQRYRSAWNGDITRLFAECAY